MKLNEGRPGLAAHLIRRYGPEGITIGADSHPLPVMVSPNDVTALSLDLAEAQPDDMEPIFGRQPSLVLVGCAGGRWQPPAAIRHAFETRRIALESMDLGAACRTFNVLVQEDREVLALLFS